MADQPFKGAYAFYMDVPGGAAYHATTFFATSPSFSPVFSISEFF